MTIDYISDVMVIKHEMVKREAGNMMHWANK